MVKHTHRSGVCARGIQIWTKRQSDRDREIDCEGQEGEAATSLLLGWAAMAGQKPAFGGGLPGLLAAVMPGFFPERVRLFVRDRTLKGIPSLQ